MNNATPTTPSKEEMEKLIKEIDDRYSRAWSSGTLDSDSEENWPKITNYIRSLLSQLERLEKEHQEIVDAARELYMGFGIADKGDEWEGYAFVKWDSFTALDKLINPTSHD